MNRIAAAFIVILLLVSCGGHDPIDPTPPTPVTPTPTSKDTKAPVITVSLSSVNAIAGVEVALTDGALKLGVKTAATWTDDVSKTCKVEITFTPAGGSSKTITSVEKLAAAGTLKLTVADEFNNTSTAEITLTAVAITGLEKLQNLALQVDTPSNLLEGLAIADGLTLQKIEIEQDGVL